MNTDHDLPSAFWAKIDHQCAARGMPLTPFARQVAESVFQAGLLALEDRQQSIRRYNVLAAPTGSGKSSFASALAAALVEEDPTASVVFLCETINQCEDTFVELQRLAPPNTVIVWTSAHDIDRDPRDIERDHGFLPRQRFDVADLATSRIAVVTHAFYKGVRGHLAQIYSGGKRTLTIIDERPKEVQLYDIELADVVSARDWATTSFGNDSMEELAFQDVWTALDQAWKTEREGRKSATTWTEQSGDLETLTTANLACCASPEPRWAAIGPSRPFLQDETRPRFSRSSKSPRSSGKKF